MKDQDKTKAQRMAEVQFLRVQVRELEAELQNSRFAQANREVSNDAIIDPPTAAENDTVASERAPAHSKNHGQYDLYKPVSKALKQERQQGSEPCSRL